MDQQTIMMLLASLMGGKTGDLSSAFLDPVLAYLTGSYSPEPTLSDEDILRGYAPTLSAYVKAAPGGGLVATGGAYGNVVSQILEGKSAFEVIQNASKDQKKNKDFANFVKSLEDDRAKFYQQKSSQATRKDQFQNMGLPGYKQGWDDQILQSMYGSQFADLSHRTAAAERLDEQRSSYRQKRLEGYQEREKSRIDAQIAALKKRAADQIAQGGAGSTMGVDAITSAMSKLEREKGNVGKTEADYKSYLEKMGTTESFSPGGAGRAAVAERLKRDALAAALSGAGRTPLGDALVSAAILKRTLGK